MEALDTSKSESIQDAVLNENTSQEELSSTPAADPQTVAATSATETNTETESSEKAPEAPAKETPRTKETVVAELRTLAAKDAADISGDELSRLKQQFYALRNEELAAEREAWKEAGNAAEDFVASSDVLEDEFKALMASIKDKKAELRAALEQQLQANCERKKAIIEKIGEMSADADNANRFFQQVRDLQTEFKEIGPVPDQATTEIWKAYQEVVEKFYDQLKINKELRDYDFKKNLGEKEAIVAEAEKLLSEEDVVVAFKRLQSLHEQWRAIGPVPKELRETIWNRFKEASTEINRRYQAHFEERKQREKENEDAKTALCERIEAIEYDGLSSYSAWDEKTALIIEAQNEWKKIGYASRKANNQLFTRFRETCDKFFAAKAEFFKNMKDNLSANLEKKIALCERAEALKDSTEWRKTTEELTALQKEWKTIGAVAKKHSEQVWRRFVDACDHFFEQKKKSTSGARKTERENLKLKNEIIAQLKALEVDAMERGEAVKALKDLQAKWQEVGHVPFGEKDNIYEAYRSVVNELYQKLNLSQRGSRMASFETSINEMADDRSRLYRERERLARAYEQRRNELQTYENNMGFLSAKSKNAGSMLRDMERRMQHLRDDIEDLRQKISVIDGKL